MNTNFFTKADSSLAEFFIWFHTIGFQLMGKAIKDYRHYGLGCAAGEMFCGVLVVLLVVCIDLLIIYGIYRLIRRISIMVRTEEVKRYKVLGTVTETEYEEEYFIHTGKALIPYPEEYNVYVEYDGVTEVFDDEELFNQYKKGDRIYLILIEKVDKNNNVIERTLELPE